MFALLLFKRNQKANIELQGDLLKHKTLDWIGEIESDGDGDCGSVSGEADAGSAGVDCG